MATPLVSIITPCFRQAHFLSAAIESVLAQTYPHVEIIVVNDGSDDNTDEVAQTYKDKITYIRQENKGLCGARNTAIAAAKGEYFLFLDSDDLLDRNAIQSMVEAVGGKRDCLALIGLRFFETDPAQGKEKLLPDEPLLPRLFADNIAPPHCYLTPAHLVKAVGGFSQRAPGCEDWELWTRIAIRGAGAVTVPRIGALYRQYAGSMSTNTLKMHGGRIQVLLGIREQIRGSETLMRQWGHVLASVEADLAVLYFDVGYHAAQGGRLSQSLASYRQSIAYGFSTPRAVAGMAKAVPHAGRHQIEKLLTRRS
jgi:hypothetical protein